MKQGPHGERGLFEKGRRRVITPRDAAQDMRALCQRAPVIPVLVIEDAAHAVPLAEALKAGGITVLEVTLRSEAALEAIEAMRAVPDVRVGAGSLRRPSDVAAAVEAGASFGVSPGATPALLDAAEAQDLPMLPGAMTPSEALALLGRGYDMQKVFPAEIAGGTAFLRALAGPIPEVSFCPTGGIDPAKAASYLAEPNVVCVGGSWLAPQDALANGDWGRITALARDAVSLNADRAGAQP